MHLYHFSEEPDIQAFEPRIIYNQTNEPAKVWTIDAFHAPHYYFPRDCPRVCIWPKEDTTAGDAEKFFGMSGTKRMVAIESGWFERVRTGTIYRYAFDPQDFELHEPNAGYYIATQTVKPLDVVRINDLLAAILQEGIELRVTPSLMLLRDAVAASTVNFSMIRMRNAVQ
ncbi:hypothetical protein GXP70_20915 [Paenibacillus lycopersici]|uniref:Uncharacterized protein n=1 Tax=Paenibacillus lycopersici TaxID=2704462 RepID=A0A6C0G498_9BACL|nr:DUF6886 family protein [Paenibacillus lycopersici]QHT62199.1 hypothetical protein GXP70_20915 [Paenibacillus lycopersici]